MHRDGGPPPFSRSNGPSDGLNHYLSLLALEREKLGPFLEVLPFCARLLNDEIRRMETLADFLGPPGPRGPPPSQAQNFGNGPYFSDPPPSMGGPPMLALAHPIGHGGGPPPLGPPMLDGGSPYGGGGPPPRSMRRKGGGPIIKLHERVRVPTDKYPEFNFVGRILGPRGTTIQQIQNDTGCKISVRGQGSLRTKEEEEAKLKSKAPGYEHLSDELHVLIEVEMPEDDANEAMGRAREIVESLLIPPETPGAMDALKIQQLNELASIKNNDYGYPDQRDMPPPPGHNGRSNRYNGYNR